MKKLVLCLGLTLFSSHLFACANNAPMSTVLSAITNNGAGNAVMDCSKLPGEECVCFDEVTEWKAAVIADAYEARPIYSSCDPEIIGCTPVITGYDQVLVGKKAIDDPLKLTALQAQRKADDDALKAKISKREAAKAQLKALDLTSATTISALKAAIKIIIDAQPD